MSFKLKKLFRGGGKFLKNFGDNFFFAGQGKKIRTKLGLRGKKVKQFVGLRSANSALNINAGMNSQLVPGTGFRRYV